MLMLKLGTPVLIDSETSGVIVGRGFDLAKELPYFDVRVGSIIVYNVKAHRLTTAGPVRKDVIGRDPGYDHNPRRLP